jgi:replicative DNA helicase
MTAHALDRPMPHSAEAERAVLAAILISPPTFYRVQLSTTDFAKDAHRLIWGALASMAEDGTKIEPLTLRDLLQQRKQLEKVGGMAYVSSLLDTLPDVANVETYTEIVRREAAKRRIIAAAQEATRRALEGEDEPEVISADLLAKLTPTMSAVDQRGKRLVEVLSDAFAEAERLYEQRRLPTLTSEFRRLNDYGVLRPTFIVVGSPSNHGKTAFLTNLASGLAKNGHRGLSATLESTTTEVGWRWVSAESGVPHSRVRDFRALVDDFPNDLRRVVETQRAAAHMPLILTRGIRTIDQLYAECRRLKATEGLEFVTIDYFQLLQSPGGPRDREERMAQISQRCLEMAIELDIAVIAASQLNKDRLERAGGRIYQADLKYASAIGESARVVLLFQRPHADDKANPDLRPCEVKFQVEKNNEGRTGDYEAHFDEITQRFADGGCSENDCRRLRGQSNEPTTAQLFG